MRQLILGIAMTFALSGVAAAQTPYQSGYTTSVTPLGEISSEAHDWMVAETMRRAQTPGGLDELTAAIDEAVGDNLEAVGSRHRLKRIDMVLAMQFVILDKARELVGDEITTRKTMVDKATASDEDMLGLQSAQSREIRLKALVEQARRRLTHGAQSVVR